MAFKWLTRSIKAPRDGEILAQLVGGCLRGFPRNDGAIPSNKIISVVGSKQKPPFVRTYTYRDAVLLFPVGMSDALNKMHKKKTTKKHDR
jgi:hypothetical protein